VPITNRDPKLILHLPPEHDPVRVIDPERQVVDRLRSPESDRTIHIRKELA
jgi:hypothetical protein